MQALIKTLFDIILIRKGPDALPPSWLLVHATVLLWFFPLFAAAALMPNFGAYSVMVAVASWLISLAVYGLVIAAVGRSPRLLQSMIALIGCGALISIIQVAEIVMLSPFLDETLVQVGALLIIFWSVRVDGHIMSRTLDREWFIGVLIAMGVFLLQYAFTSAMVPAD